MRFKSFDVVPQEVADAFGRSVQSIRGRYSQVQNNFMHVSIGYDSQHQMLPWYCELQPLRRKDGKTLSTALIQAVGGVMDACMARHQSHPERPSPARFVHLLVGDGLNTNELCGKILLHHFRSTQHSPVFRYYLLSWRCAYHKCNLVTMVAVVGKLMANAHDTDALCATRVRLYKHLVSYYSGQFAASLRRYLMNGVRLHHDAAEPSIADSQERTSKLVSLYGEKVLPPQVDIIVQPRS